MSLSNYPPGFGSARDWDHVAGPVSEEELEERHGRTGWDGFIVCHGHLIREVWHGGNVTVVCGRCGELVREEDPA